MKTLDEVEARTTVSAPGTDLAAPGSYYLTQDLVLSSSDSFGVRILSEDVTLDLNGFTVVGTGTQVGVRINNPASNVTVRNGAVRDCNIGLWVSFLAGDRSQGIRVRDVSAVRNASIGFYVTAVDDVVFERCLAVDNGDDGFDFTQAAIGCRVSDSTANDNGAYGILINNASAVLERNVCNRNALSGIQIAADATRMGSVMDNHCHGNTQNGIRAFSDPDGYAIAGNGGADFILTDAAGASPIALSTDANPSPFANIRLP
jgi:hypothetical protein